MAPRPVPGVDPSRPHTIGPVANAARISASWPKNSASRDCAERRDHDPGARVFAHPRHRLEGGDIHQRHRDHRSGERARIELARELGHRDDPLLLVPVDASVEDEDGSRPRSVHDHRRESEPAPVHALHRMDETGGALARPFSTHHHRLDRKMFLRIADELYLKRLIVGNLDRVYEIGHDFRNEGVDRTHNPEFTMLELYFAFADYDDVMKLTETMVGDVAREGMGTTRFEYDGTVIDLAAPWARVRWDEAFSEATGLDPRRAGKADLRALAKETGRADADELSRVQILDTLFSQLVEGRITDPVFVYGHPIEMSPLAKPLRGEPDFAERFEVVVCGFELVNAFSELNDPADQWNRFAAQQRLREAGDQEAMAIDEDYVRALEYGLPPTGGVGVGVDRVVMLLTDQASIRDVILFPTLREAD